MRQIIDNMRELVRSYRGKPSIAVLASHSALDVLDGAKEEGFRTIAICKRGRDLAYKRFRRIIDYCLEVDDYKDVLTVEIQQRLIENKAIFIPNRSFAVYVGYDAIERDFEVPIFGNRFLLRWEERTGEKNYYKLLDEAGIRRPLIFKSPDDIDRPVIVKLPHAKKRVERGFFIAKDREDYYKKVEKLKKRGIIDDESLKNAVIEELILGALFNVNYFYSPTREEVELHSMDRRIQTNLDGFLRLPASEQLGIDVPYTMIEMGHTPVTMRESMLHKIFEIGDKFLEASRRLEPPGVIGPFTLQLFITDDMEPVVFDVALRIGGGTNIYMGVGAQYSKLYFGKPLSMGKRIALEIAMAFMRKGMDGLSNLVT